MSGFRSQPLGAGSKATGPGSTHQRTDKPRAGGGAKASGAVSASGGRSTHEALAPDRRAKAGAKASNAGRNSIVAEGQAVSNPHDTAAEQRKPKGRAVAHYHGVEHVTEHHRR